jgi:hypothetical protein
MTKVWTTETTWEQAETGCRFKRSTTVPVQSELK